MKRIEATVQSNKIGAVSNAISKVVGGFTIMEGNGRGSGERQTIRAGRGTATFVAEYNKVATITTIVDDSQVDAIISEISEAASTGNSGDGIIVISSVEDVVSISSKKRGSEAL